MHPLFYASLFIIGIFAMIRFFAFLGAQIAGWSELMKAFPDVHMGEPLQHFRRVTAAIGSTKLKRALDVKIYMDGFRLKFMNSGQPSIFIPWKSVETVDLQENSALASILDVLVTIRYYRRFELYVPRTITLLIRDLVPTHVVV